MSTAVKFSLSLQISRHCLHDSDPRSVSTAAVCRYSRRASLVVRCKRQMSFGLAIWCCRDWFHLASSPTHSHLLDAMEVAERCDTTDRFSEAHSICFGKWIL